MNGFTKLFGSIVTSSIWVQDHATLRVWIAMLATANAQGVVAGSIPGFSSLCRVTFDEMQRAEELLLSPDPWSRSKEHDGRRIERVDGGWLILNYAAYRERLQNQEGSRADDMRRYRERQREQEGRNALPIGVTRYTEAEAEAEAEAEDRRQKTDKDTDSQTPQPELPGAVQTEIAHQCAGESEKWLESNPSAFAGHSSEQPDNQKPPTTTNDSPATTKKRRFQPPTIETCRLLAAKAGMPESEGEKFFSYYASNGWRVGKNPMRSAEHAIAGWAVRWRERYGGAHGGSPVAVPRGSNHTSLTISSAGLVAKHVEMAQAERLRRQGDPGHGVGGDPVGA